MRFREPWVKVGILRIPMPRIPISSGILVAVAAALALGFAFGQDGGSFSQPAFQAREKIDSLRRHLDRSLFSSAEQEAWKACIRGKREFLEAARKRDTAFAGVDSLLRRAKMARTSPQDPEVAKLLERKFLLEKDLENRYLASETGRRCLEIEGKRRTRIGKAMEKNADYRRWKKLAEPLEAPPEPI